MRDRKATPLEQITDNINQLTRPYQHRETLTPIAERLQGVRHYVTDHPSLLDQLRLAIHPAVAEIDYGGTAFGSRPPTNTDALNALMRIESAAAWWLKIEYQRELRGSAEDNLSALKGASTEPHRTNGQLRDLAVDTHHWLTWARTESGWQPRPLTISDPCPALVCEISRRLIWDGTCNNEICDSAINFRPCPTATCGRRESIRVHQPANSAWCTHCGAAWSEYNPNLPSVLLLVDALVTQRGAA